VRTEHRIRPHGELIPLADNLWYVRGTAHMPVGDLERNMVVYRLPSGELLLHSVIAMNEGGMRSLEALGKPAFMVVPHGGHRLDATFYKERYPELRVFAPAAARAKVDEIIKTDAAEEDALPSLGIGVYKIDGLKPTFGENALVVNVRDGKALILNDLLWGKEIGGNFLIRLLGTSDGELGLPRAVKWASVADKDAVKASLQRLAEIPDLELLTVSHGSPIRGQVAEGIREAALHV